MASADGQAEYEAWLKTQSGGDYLGKEKKAEWWNDYNNKKTTQMSMDGYLNNPGGGMVVGGDAGQQARVGENLSQVGAMTGQNLFQTGAQNQDYLASLQERRAGGDAVGQYMMDGRNRAQANMGRQFAGKKVAGGVAGAAMASAGNEADSSINAQGQKNARTNDQDLFGFLKRQQKIEGEAIAMGKDQNLADKIDVSAGEGITVICGELHRQGLMDDETYALDAEFGANLRKHDPYVMVGYLTFAPTVVKYMQKSKIFTKFVAFFGTAWAKDMAGKESLLGSMVMAVGMPLCRRIGILVSIHKGAKRV